MVLIHLKPINSTQFGCFNGKGKEEKHHGQKERQKLHKKDRKKKKKARKDLKKYIIVFCRKQS